MQQSSFRWSVALGVVALLGIAVPSAFAVCAGDCDGSGTVTTVELLTILRSALSTGAVGDCSAADPSGDGLVKVNDVLTAVNVAVSGCTEGRCGDGIVQFNLGETCDDGNTMDGDSCPANCHIASCTPSGTTLDADVMFTTPVDLAAITVLVRYPDGVVSIPGSSNDPAVFSRLTNLPDNGFSTPNDLDYALRLVIISPDLSPLSTAAPGLLFSVQFDNCRDASPPSAQDFRCTVEDTSDTNDPPAKVDGVTCAISLH